jgi:hypothetical protein
MKDMKVSITESGYAVHPRLKRLCHRLISLRLKQAIDKGKSKEINDEW